MPSAMASALCLQKEVESTMLRMPEVMVGCGALGKGVPNGGEIFHVRDVCDLSEFLDFAC
eukprot:15361977-Ditylum_brightwellii.AAC.2